MQADHYDAFADSYGTENDSSLLNAYYERPAMVRLAGDVTGRRILDAGCGTGPLAAELLARGAVVTGFDGSPAMIALARRRLGDDVPLHVADLAEPLPFADDTFDDVTASLVLHYLEDWSAPLAEIRRVLKPGGRLILSVNHPFVHAFSYPDEDNFATRQYAEDFEFDGEPAVLTFWHRPLSTMSQEFSAAGFRIAVIDEPAPSPDTPAELLTPRIASGERTRFFCFLFFVLEAA
jgi:ubiquinone/menaquinone biosynthesis C-methylase UbiE